MFPFRKKKPKIDERLVASIREALSSPAPTTKPKRRLFVDARAELKRIAEEEAKRN